MRGEGIVSRLLSWFLPELDRFPRKEDRHSAFQKAYEAAGDNRYGLGAFALGVIICLTPEWSPWLLPQGAILSWITNGSMGWFFLLGTTAATLVYLPRARHLMRRSLWRQLAESDIPCCVRCGYDLTGNRSGVCPECGVEAQD
jgi:hypothetical protein